MANVDVAVRNLMKDYGEGKVTVQRAAELVKPVYDQARAARAQRTTQTNDTDPDAAFLDTNPWIQVDLARQMKVITVAQYGALCDTLIAMERKAP